MAAEIEIYNSSLPAAATQLSDDALAFIGEAIAYNTCRAYAAQLKIWFAYCEQLGRAPFPADPVAVANWIAERANSGERSGKRATDCKLGQSMSTLRVAVAAIKAAHDSKGIEFDTGHVALRKFFQGLRRKRPEAQIQAAPLRADVLVEVISSLGSSPIEARDAALLALGYIFARRRSELAGLDLGTLGTGDGYLTRDARHLTVTLLRHKTQGNEPEVYVVPRAPATASLSRPSSIGLPLRASLTGNRCCARCIRRVLSAATVSTRSRSRRSSSVALLSIWFAEG